MEKTQSLCSIFLEKFEKKEEPAKSKGKDGEDEEKGGKFKSYKKKLDKKKPSPEKEIEKSDDTADKDDDQTQPSDQGNAPQQQDPTMGGMFSLDPRRDPRLRPAPISKELLGLTQRIMSRYSIATNPIVVRRQAMRGMTPQRSFNINGVDN